MLNQTKTYYCVQNKYNSKDIKTYILFSTRELARKQKAKMFREDDLAIVKVNVAVHWGK